MWSLSRLPILQAPTGSIAGPELCGAVAAAGGMGAMGLTWTEPETARSFVREVFVRLGPSPPTPSPMTNHTGEGALRSFQVNFVLHFEPKALVAVLEEGAPVITFSWGMPDAYVGLVRSFGAKFGVQVVTREAARRAIDLGADFLICQGVEAGGHVQSSTPLFDLLPEILDEAKETPVVAAGGLADGRDVARVLAAGASAAMLGTRFVATRESRAHEIYKQRLVESGTTALTLCFDGGWPHAQHRVLRNETIDGWESAGCPPPGKRPGEGDEVARSGVEPILRYEDTAPRVGMEGSIGEMCLYAGTGCAKIADLPAAADLVAKLWNEARPD
ncbi:MAG TPA: nitronate monooxygenase [Fimbriimonadaceae bacterium]|nr:nitronate monooxygenase [Fimbriimonadaceae bacterium]